jgi:flagellar hook-associated protein 2
MGISFNAAQLLNGNGIDVNSLVSQVQAQESGQLNVWQGQLNDLQTQSTDLGTLNTDLSNLQTAVQALSDPLGALNSMTATSSLPAVLTATADPTATAGNHTIVVSNLASAGTVYTSPVTGGANASILPSGATGGVLQLQIGGSGGTTANIQITKGNNDTLSELVSYINQQSAANKWGVTATVLNDASGARLAIYSQATGTPGALAITGNTATGILNTNDVASTSTSLLSDPTQSGDIQLQIGGSGGTTIDLPITAGSNDTLSSLQSYINQQSSANNWGISANVVQDSNGYHLSVTSSATGAAGAISIVSNTNTTLTAAANPPTNLSFEAPVGGTNAEVTIDGIPFSSTSNTVTGALPGVTLNLVSAEPGVPLQLSVGADTTDATTAINAFVTAYNAVVTAINQQFAVNPSTNNEGPLGSDSSVRTLQSSLLADVNYSISGNSGLVNLASLGISMNDNGTLSVDNTALSNAMSSNPTAFLNFFQNSSSTGFANNFNKDLTNLTDPTTGILNVDLSQNSTQQSDLNTEITNFQDQLATQKQQLIQEYSQVNASLEEYPYLLAEVTATLGQILPNSSNTSPNEGMPTSGSSSSSSSSTSGSSSSGG